MRTGSRAKTNEALLRGMLASHVNQCPKCPPIKIYSIITELKTVCCWGNERDKITAERTENQKIPTDISHKWNITQWRKRMTQIRGDGIPLLAIKRNEILIQAPKWMSVIVYERPSMIPWTQNVQNRRFTISEYSLELKGGVSVLKGNEVWLLSCMQFH